MLHSSHPQFSTQLRSTILTTTVGNTGINFTPNSTTAAVGDILAFHFYTGTGPHSVVRSTFNSPCAPEVGAAEFYSGYLVGDDAGSQTYEVTVTNTDPIVSLTSLANTVSKFEII